MENASKALMMSAGVLIGILILSLAVYLFMDFGARSQEIYERVEHNQLTKYNAQYTIYEGRDDITIYDIVTLCNLAKQNNDTYKDYTDFSNIYKVTIKLSGSSDFNYPNAQEELSMEEEQELIHKYNEPDADGNLKKQFKCEEVSFHDSGRVKEVKIKKIE